MITVTQAARDKIRSVMTKRQTPGHYLRIALQGGGCSGFMYSYDLVPEPDEKDKIFEFDDVKICIDICMNWIIYKQNATHDLIINEHDKNKKHTMKQKKYGKIKFIQISDQMTIGTSKSELVIRKT